MPRKRTLPSGMKQRGQAYYACFRAHGRLIQKKLSSDFRAASEMLNNLRARADRADFGLMDNDFSLSDLRVSYERHCALTLRARTAARYRQNLDAILSTLPVTKVSQITTAVVNAFRESRMAGDDGVSPRTVNMDVTALSTMLNWAVKEQLIGTNPLIGLKPLPTKGAERKERRALSLEEVVRLFAGSPEHLRPVWRMFMTTGIRLGELCALKFTDVDFERGEVVIRAGVAKGKKARSIPLDEEMLATLQQLRTRAAGRQPGRGNTPAITTRIAERFSRQHVFVTTANTPWHGRLLDRFYAICRRAGIDGAEFGGSVDIHSLRVSFATLAIENGASPKAVQEILGHSTLDLTMRVYSKATERAKRAAVGALPFASVPTPANIVAMPSACTAHSTAQTELQVVAG